MAVHRADVPAEIIVDDADESQVEITAYWKRLPASQVDGAFGSSVLSDEGLGVDSVVRLLPAIAVDGLYEVYLYWPALKGTKQLATNAPVTVRHAAGSSALTLDQRKSPKTWLLLGTYELKRGRPAYVELRNDAADGVVLADAAGFRLVERKSSGP